MASVPLPQRGSHVSVPRVSVVPTVKPVSIYQRLYALIESNYLHVDTAANVQQA